MDFSLTAEQRMMQDALIKTLADFASLDRVRRYADGRSDGADLWLAMADFGLAGMLVPETYGGLGLTLLDAALAAEAFGRFVSPGPFIGAMLAPLALIAGGTEDQKAKWLPRLASGNATAAIAIAEPIAGARDGGGVGFVDGRLSGHAHFVLDGAGADLIVVADQSGGLHLVGGDAIGLTIQAMPGLDQTRRMATIQFENVIGETLSRGPHGLSRLRDAGWVLLAADTLGACDVMVEKAVAYAKERKQFGRVIGSFQAVKHMCAEMAAEIEPSRSLVWYAAYAFDAVVEESSLTAAHAKAHLSEIGRFVARTATEVHGGMGITDLLGLHYWFKRVGLNRQLFGGPERVRRWAAKFQGLVA